MAQNKAVYRWNFKYVTPDGHIIYPFRHLMTYSYLLEADHLGNRLQEVNIRELQTRVLASDELFACWKAELEYDGIFVERNPGVISDEYFSEVKRLVDERYEPFMELFQGYTGHEIIDMIHSSSKVKAKELTDVIEMIVKETIGIPPRRINANIIEVMCQDYRWVVWIEIFTSKGQIQNTDPIVESMKIVNNFLRRNQEFMTYFMACGPAFGPKFSQIARDELVLLWSLSIINFIREMLILPTEFNQGKIAACFPEFFKGQEGKSAHSTSEAFDRLRRCAGS